MKSIKRMIWSVVTIVCVLLSTVLSVLGCSADPVESNILPTENFVDEVIEADPKPDPDPEPITTTVNIKMVGDCLIHSSVYKAAQQEGGTYNFDFLFEHVADDIQSADIAIINQETIFTADPKKYSGYPQFGSPVEVGAAEVNAGFDVVCHATNHTIDKGVDGIQDTLSFWSQNYPDIKVLGIHELEGDDDVTRMVVNGISIAFVNYTYGLNGLESRRNGKEYLVDLLSDDDVEQTLAYAKESADITVAILHVGNEYVYKPTTYAMEQVDRFIDNGADIVLCAHPHVVEPYEMRTTANGNTGLVYYSLGNFVSAQDEYPRVLGGMADITITKTRTPGKDDEKTEITSYDMIPLVTHQERGIYTTYLLDEYTDELASRHKLGITKNQLQNLWNQIMSGEIEQATEKTDANPTDSDANHDVSDVSEAVQSEESVVQLKTMYTYANMIQDMQTLCMMYPSVVSKSSIGTSVLENDIPIFQSISNWVVNNK